MNSVCVCVVSVVGEPFVVSDIGYLVSLFPFPLPFPSTPSLYPLPLPFPSAPSLCPFPRLLQAELQGEVDARLTSERRLHQALMERHAAEVRAEAGDLRADEARTDADMAAQHAASVQVRLAK